MGLDFGHTCGEIDGYMDDAKKAIEFHIDSMLDEASPLAAGELKNKFVKDSAHSLYEEIAHAFEQVRKTNEEMRKEADRQIDDLIDENERLKADIENLEQEIRDLS